MSIVINWYQEKTRPILEKYGPGPRVHYHMGVMRPDILAAPEQTLLQRQLAQSQEDMMIVASRFWETPDLTGKRLLDVGAGLGGASLWMAMQHNATVDSLIQFPEHASIIRAFAAFNGIASSVSVFQGDAHAFTPHHGQKYDVVMAMESPCYFNRLQWFRHLDTILAPGGQIWVEDALLGPEPPADAKPTFDAYWKTDVGSATEYLRDAETAGFVGKHLDITQQTSEFWRLSAIWVERELRNAEKERDEARVKRLQRSFDSAILHYKYWCLGFYRVGLFSFQRA